MSTIKNIFSNYMATSVAIILPILSLPWFLSRLGAENFGLIGFVAMLQATLSLLDAGLSQALVREVAIRFDEPLDGRRKAASLLMGFERIYWGFSLTAAAIVFFSANFLAKYWLNLGGLPLSAGFYAVCGAAFIFAFQFPGSVYRSFLIGAQAQISLNRIIVCGVFFRQVGGMIVVYLYPTLSAYLIWQCVISLGDTLARRVTSWRVAGGLPGISVPEDWCSIFLRVAGLSGSVFLGALTVQLDKIILSKLVSIKDFGYYTIASVVAFGVLQLIYPIMQAILPRIVQLRADASALRELNFKLLYIFLLMINIGILVFYHFGEFLLEIWLGQSAIVGEVYPLLGILLIGVSLNYIYNIGYNNWIACGETKIIFYINFISLIAAIIFLPYFIGEFGVIGASFSWVAINFIGLSCSFGWLRKGKA